VKEHCYLKIKEDMRFYSGYVTLWFLEHIARLLEPGGAPSSFLFTEQIHFGARWGWV
jgi:hypothetical protein